MYVTTIPPIITNKTKVIIIAMLPKKNHCNTKNDFRNDSEKTTS